jgi:SNF2 family DNA or RNA helicase
MQQNEFGAWEILGLKEKDALSRVIQPYYLRREKVDVAPELPPKTRIFDHKLLLTSKQQKMYHQLEEEMIAELSTGELLITPTVLAKITRLRQVLCTPRLLDPDQDYGASLDHLQELLNDTDDHHFIVFTPFARSIPVIQEFLQLKCNIPSYQIQTLQGGLSAEIVNGRIQAFRSSKGICICTIQYAESFDLTPATWSYFLGFSWSATENLQAEDRIHRLTTTQPTTYYYPQHHNCIDEDLIMPALDEKATEILKVLDTADRLRDILSRRREGEREGALK